MHSSPEMTWLVEAGRYIASILTYQFTSSQVEHGQHPAAECQILDGSVSELLKKTECGSMNLQVRKLSIILENVINLCQLSIQV